MEGESLQQVLVRRTREILDNQPAALKAIEQADDDTQQFGMLAVITADNDKRIDAIIKALEQLGFTLNAKGGK